MNTQAFRKWSLSCFVTAALSACAGDAHQRESPFSSDQATLLTFEFDSKILGAELFFGNTEDVIRDQLLYTIGDLNGARAVGRLDNLELSNIETTEREDGLVDIQYHAVLPVGWGSKTDLPTNYELTLPLHVDANSLERFTAKHKADCVDALAHDVDVGSMWYYYRPNIKGCKLASNEVTRVTASVTVSSLNTNQKYPEYDAIWQDNQLEVIAIFGKYEEGGDEFDSGARGYNRFIEEVLFLPEATNVLETEGSSATIEVPLDGGRKLRVSAFLVDSITNPGAAFAPAYHELSKTADLIVYNGHSGLGQNIRALARMGQFQTGKYQIFFMNGCDSFAYVDGFLAEARAQLNPDDPTGTKYMEIVTNVMPSFFVSMPYATMAIVEGLMRFDAPLSYDEIFEDVDHEEVVVVTGEEDNVFTPSN